MKEVKQFLEKYRNGEFKSKRGKALYNDIRLMKQDSNFDITVVFLNNAYQSGYGLKSMIKEFDLPTTYSCLRFLFDLIGVGRKHGQSVVTDRLKDFRSKKAIADYNNKTGFFAENIQEQIKIRSTVSRGISGYYFNKSKNKYVWLRSSWEYIYAKWLDIKNIIWDVEYKTFTLKNGKRYRPDFFIFENNILQSIVETKGYWKDKVWKFNELKNTFNNEDSNIELILITNITPYLINSTYKKELNKWKKIRIIKLNKND